MSAGGRAGAAGAARRPSRRYLGKVGELAAAWGLAGRLERARHVLEAPAARRDWGQAWRDCLDSGVESDGRAALQAGRAWPGEKRILLHRELLKAGREGDRDATFLHECAHVLADRHHGLACRHGPLWRSVMVALGETPAVRHDIPYLSRRAHAAYVWACTACGESYPFLRRPRRRIRDCYCRRCGPRLGRLVETAPPPARPESAPLFDI